MKVHAYAYLLHASVKPWPLARPGESVVVSYLRALIARCLFTSEHLCTIQSNYVHDCIYIHIGFIRFSISLGKASPQQDRRVRDDMLSLSTVQACTRIYVYVYIYIYIHLHVEQVAIYLGEIVACINVLTALTPYWEMHSANSCLLYTSPSPRD